ncbi:hypothetical protein HK100_007064 [Physocladia obscura]|uniref:Uncharacterized protein n=1 Tax=Physocladia obscura TaxID=109957 RepID=A0AAD5SPS4_9FUNG|nr:hypothetical protein HK100_007064 [Physocladia obscura]
MVQSILVTGANKGLGFEAVRLLSAAFPRATIFLGTRSIANGEKALAKLRAESLGRHVQVLEIDVADVNSIKHASEEIRATTQSLDVLINNAAILLPTANPEDIKAVLDVNLFGLKNVIDAFLLLMPSAATIINVYSEIGAGVHYRLPQDLQQVLENINTLSWTQIEALANDYQSTQPQYAWHSNGTVHSYGASKVLMNAFSRLLANDQPDLRVFAVCPGYCDTDMNGHAGFRSPVAGAFSIVWPLLNIGLSSGLFYRDGQPLPFSSVKMAETEGGNTPDPNDEYWY